MPPMPLCRVFVAEHPQNARGDTGIGTGTDTGIGTPDGGRTLVLVHATEPQQATGTVRWRHAAFQCPMPLQPSQDHAARVWAQHARTKLIFAVHDYGPLDAACTFFIGQAEAEVSLLRLGEKALDLQLPLRGGSAGSGARLHVQLRLHLRTQDADSRETGATPRAIVETCAANQTGTHETVTATSETHAAQTTAEQHLMPLPRERKQMALKSRPQQVVEALQSFRARAAGHSSGGVSVACTSIKNTQRRPVTATPELRLRAATLRVASAERRLQQHAACIGDAAPVASDEGTVQGPTRARYLRACARASELAAAGQHLPVTSDSLSSVRAFIEQYNLPVDTAVHPATEGRTLRTRSDLVDEVRALLTPETSKAIAAGVALGAAFAPNNQMGREDDGSSDDLLDLDASPPTSPQRTRRQRALQYRFCTRCMRETEAVECGRSGLFQHSILCSGHGGPYPQRAGAERTKPRA